MHDGPTLPKSQIPRLRHLLALAVSAAACLGAGCSTFNAAATDRVALIAPPPMPDEDWPVRRADAVAETLRSAPKVIAALIPDGSRPESELPPEVRSRLERPAARVVYSEPFGRGLMRILRYGGGRGWAALRFVSYTTLEGAPEDVRLKSVRNGTASWLRRFQARGIEGVRLNDPKILSMLYEGTSVQLYEPLEKPTGSQTGLIVHLAGLGSLDYEEELIETLRRRGWAVLRIATPRAWWFEAPPVEISCDADIEPAAARLAAVIDDLVAEPAYATEAALEYLAERRPGLSQKPLVMLGCSAGALVAPAVVARMPDRFDAAILVAGGANLLRISQTSDLTDGGIAIEWPPGGPSAGQRERLFRAYLEHSRLDPYHAARYLRDKPVLMVHAEFDTTVPAETGRVLFERLGRPDRISFLLGHRLLFWILENHAERIASWLDRAIGNRVDRSRLVAGDREGRGTAQTAPHRFEPAAGTP